MKNISQNDVSVPDNGRISSITLNCLEPRRRPTVRRSKFVANLLLTFIVVGFTSSLAGMIPKNPLRLIVSRFPLSAEFNQVEKIYGFLDTLDCGHQREVFNLGLGPCVFVGTDQKRHRCLECAVALSQKKPVQSVAAVAGKKAA